MTDYDESPDKWKTKLCGLQRQFIEPSYKNIGTINPTELRYKFQVFLNELASELETFLPDDHKIGNQQMANIHHEQFLISLDIAKDHYIKFILAACAEPKQPM